jgi:hypothetical protein
MFNKSVLSFIAAAVLLGAVSPVFAQDDSQSTFSISPPPIATPVFEAGESAVKFGAMYLTMKGTDVDFNLNGYGASAVGRTAFSSTTAMDYTFGMTFLSGDIGLDTGLGTSSGLNLYGLSIPMSFNVEVQPYRNEQFNVIVFAGPALNMTFMTIENVPTVVVTTLTEEVLNIMSFLYGLQGGLQAGLELGKLHVDVFGMVTQLQGTQTIETTFEGSTSSSIPAYLTQSYGIDFTYVPWGLTLSSILQQAKQGDDNGFKTNIYQLSWSRKF